MIYITQFALTFAPTPVWRQETPNCMITGVLTQQSVKDVNPLQERERREMLTA